MTMKFRIEPDLKYCPQCKDEYRADIEICAACSVELLSGIEMKDIEQKNNAKFAGRSMQIQEGDELVDIRKGAVLEIKQVQALLSREGFPSQVVSDSQSCGKGCCGTDVLLRVRRTDVEEIFAIFQREHFTATALHEHDMSLTDSVYNPDAGQATCPACGHIFATQGNSCPDCGLCF